MSLKKKGGKSPKKPRCEELLPESDENFAYIAGYTPGGMPYGITWEEAEEIEARDAERRAKQPSAQQGPVSLKELVDNLYMVSDICTVYYQRSTGEYYRVTEEHRRLAEDGYDLEDRADWEQEEILEAQRILFNTDGDYVPLPSHYDIHDYYIMHDFCFSLPKGRIAEDLIRSISGRGAFRRFKGVVQRHGIEQNWYRFRDEAYKATAQQWCEENGLGWREGPGPT